MFFQYTDNFTSNIQRGANNIQKDECEWINVKWYIWEIKLKISNTFRLLKIYTHMNIFTFILNSMELQLYEIEFYFARILTKVMFKKFSSHATIPSQCYDSYCKSNDGPQFRKTVTIKWFPHATVSIENSSLLIPPFT